MTEKYIIYVAVCEESEKCYVGQTVRTLKARKSQHERNSRSGAAAGAFTLALRKYGWDAFTWWELETVVGVECANEREAYYINKLNSLSPNGYNLDSGGGNKTVHADTRKRQSEAWKHREPLSREARQKISNALKGRPKPPFTEEHRQNISKAVTGTTHTEETRKKMSAARKGKKRSAEVCRKIAASRKDKKAITLIRPETGETLVFESHADAARAFDVSPSAVAGLVKGRIHVLCGWRLHTPPV